MRQAIASRGLLLAAMALTAAALPSAADAAACAEIEDDAARLACYDQLAEPPKAPEPEAVAARPATNATEAVADGAADAEAAKESPGVFRRLFGAEKMRREQPLAIKAEIVRVAKLARGNYQLTLADGQVWRENEYERRTSYREGDIVVISRGAIGSYNLRNERTGHSNKVRRIQ